MLTKLSGFLGQLFGIATAANEPTRLSLTAAQLAVDVVAEIASQGPQSTVQNALQDALPQVLGLITHVAHKWYAKSRRGPWVVIAHDDLVREIEEASQAATSRWHRWVCCSDSLL